jgi:hypothetical protein
MQDTKNRQLAVLTAQYIKRSFLSPQLVAERSINKGGGGRKQ